MCFVASPDGTRLAKAGVVWSLYKVERRYQWFNQDGRWRQVAAVPVSMPGWSAHFRVEKWDSTKDVEYRVRHGQQAHVIDQPRWPGHVFNTTCLVGPAGVLYKYRKGPGPR